MKNKIVMRIGILLLCIAGPCHAIIVSFFTDIDRFIEHSQDIVIGTCISIPKGFEMTMDGFHPVNVEVVEVLKGAGIKGPLKIATIYHMTPGETYLLSSSGGDAYGTTFLAIAEMTVVP